MRYFWHFLLTAFIITCVIFLFFIFSVKVKNNIDYTDQTKITAPQVTIADPAIGPANAPLTIVNFGDYECQSCGKLDSLLTDLRSDYGDKLRIVWKDMPNSSVHKQALPAAIAARCAQDQNKFWEYHLTLMSNQKILGSELYTTIAQELKLKMNSFNRCIANEETLPMVNRSYEEGLALQISATPTIFINGQRYSGELTSSALKKTLDQLLQTM